MDKARKIWETHGEDEAYYAVATFDKFRRNRLDAEAKSEFFKSGEDHVAMLCREFEGAYSTEFRPRHALDFGCGVGRVLIALAKVAGTVTGVDIADSMLAETRKSCREREVSNFSLATTDEFLREKDIAKYDFVHSYIVLQHIKPKRGLRIIKSLVQRLEPNGLGMLHITFYDPTSTFRKLRSLIYREVPFVHRFISLLRGKSDNLLIPIYTYDLNSIFRTLDENSCEDIFIRFSFHGMYGASIFFRKANKDDYGSNDKK